jgi:hypothetical protein
MMREQVFTKMNESCECLHYMQSRSHALSTQNMKQVIDKKACERLELYISMQHTQPIINALPKTAL